MVIGNRNPTRHFCEIGELVIGFGESGGLGAHRYERESFQKMGVGRQFIGKKDVFEIGKL